MPSPSVLVDAVDLARLVAGVHTTPHDVLGVHPARLQGTAGVTVRAWHPDASAAEVLWADGTTPRKSEGLVYERSDLANDGTHPSQSGRRKVADMLLKFFQTDPLASTWYLRK